MTPDQVTEMTRHALSAGLLAAAPLLAAALLVGVVIGLLQALTQVQETTLSFVPKLVAVGAALALATGFIGGALGGLMRQSLALVAGG